jgi:excisionase family DNA binding protein
MKWRTIVPNERVEKLLTIKEVCEELRVSKHTIYKWLRSADPDEHLQGFALPGGRSYRVRRVDLDDFLNRHAITPEHNWQDEFANEDDE